MDWHSSLINSLSLARGEDDRQHPIIEDRVRAVAQASS
jgi:hypothetical protein